MASYQGLRDHEVNLGDQIRVGEDSPRHRRDLAGRKFVEPEESCQIIRLARIRYALGENVRADTPNNAIGQHAASP
ncbi:hypothetical protein D9M71_573710 [compost metagenome]